MRDRRVASGEFLRPGAPGRERVRGADRRRATGSIGNRQTNVPTPSPRDEETAGNGRHVRVRGTGRVRDAGCRAGVEKRGAE